MGWRVLMKVEYYQEVFSRNVIDYVGQRNDIMPMTT